MVAVSGASDSTISGWADVLEAVSNDIGGCFSCFCFLAFDLTFLTVDFAFRPPPPPSKTCQLFQATADELGAALRGMFQFFLLFLFFFFLLCYG